MPGTREGPDDQNDTGAHRRVMLAEHQGLSNKVRSSWQWLTGRSLTFDDPGAGSRRLKIATDMSKFRPKCENEPGDTVAADTLNEVQMPNAFLCFWLWRRLYFFGPRGLLPKRYRSLR